MKHGKRLTRKMIKALEKFGADPKLFLYTKQDHEGFIPLNILTGVEWDKVYY